MTVAVTECDDCGYGLIGDSEFITMYQLSHQFFAFTICQFCERGIHVEISSETANQFLIHGVMLTDLDPEIEDA